MKKLSVITVIIVLFFGIVLINGCTQQKQTDYGGQQNTPPVQQNVPSDQQTAPPIEQKPAGQTSGQTFDVEIKGFAFTPSEIKIKKGETVTWTNKDSAPHKVVSDSGNELGSQALSNGDTYSHTFSQTGTFGYHCAIHPSMKASVIVE